MIFQSLKPLVERSANVGNSGGFFNMFGASTSNGIVVNEQSALTLSAFYNGIEILSNDYAKLPKGVYQNINGSRQKTPQHPVNFLISKRPNETMSAFMFDKLVLMYAVLKGNFYAEIKRNDFSGQPLSIEVIDQSTTTVDVRKVDGSLFYNVGGRMIPAINMIHVPGFSFNGITGISVVQHAAKSLGVSLSSNEFAADYYENKGAGAAVVTTAKPMDGEAKTRYANALSERLNGPGQYKVSVLDEMASFQQIRLTPQESQFLLTHQNGVIEVARWLNIPPHKLKSLDNANYSNMESQNIAHVSDSVIPFSIKSQQEFEYKLFTSQEIARGVYIKHNTGILLQADKKTQAEYFSKLLFAGALTRNEVRQLMDLNKLEGLDEPLTPVNTQTFQQIDKKLKE